MIRYELIKEYPGSPNIGYIAWCRGLEDSSPGWEGTEFYNKYPEYWRLINELCVPIGTEFIDTEKKNVYVIHSFDGNDVNILIKNTDFTFKNSISSVNHSFLNRAFVLFEEIK